MLKDEYKVYEEKMRKSIDSVAADFAAVRAGRANAAVLDRISVDYYGTPTPIQQIASIGSPDPRQLLIQPWDASAVKLIEKAILNSDLGINPQNDGKAIRLTFPQLTEERRKELVKQIRTHFEGTPYDPYGTTGTAESRHRYRPIGVNRTGHMVAIQVRPYVPAANRTVMWVSFGSGPFTAAAPFYANVNDTPVYLRDTTPEVSTGNLYWTNRLIAVVADAHWYETNRFIEGYAEGVRAFGHRLIERTDEQLLARSDAASTDTNAWPLDGGHGDEKDVQGVADVLEAANDEMADYLREHTTKLLNDVLYTSSNLMHNSFAMSDRWAE